MDWNLSKIMTNNISLYVLNQFIFCMSFGWMLAIHFYIWNGLNSLGRITFIFSIHQLSININRWCTSNLNFVFSFWQQSCWRSWNSSVNDVSLILLHTNCDHVCNHNITSFTTVKIYKQWFRHSHTSSL